MRRSDTPEAIRLFSNEFHDRWRACQALTGRSDASWDAAKPLLRRQAGPARSGRPGVTRTARPLTPRLQASSWCLRPGPTPGAGSRGSSAATASLWPLHPPMGGRLVATLRGAPLPSSRTSVREERHGGEVRTKDRSQRSECPIRVITIADRGDRHDPISALTTDRCRCSRRSDAWNGGISSSRSAWRSRAPDADSGGRGQTARLSETRRARPSGSATSPFRESGAPAVRPRATR